MSNVTRTCSESYLFTNETPDFFTTETSRNGHPDCDSLGAALQQQLEVI